MNAVGISLAPRGQPVWPLLREGLMRFDAWHDQSMGYFQFIAPQFESYAQRDAKIGIAALNVLVCLRGEDLVDSLKACSALERQLDGFPNSWRPFLGTERRPNEPERKIQPLLFKRRARQIIDHLRTLLLRAQELHGAVVYGSGVPLQASMQHSTYPRRGHVLLAMPNPSVKGTGLRPAPYVER